MAADEARRSRLLIITPRFPFPLLGGDRVRIYHLALSLSKRFDVTLASLCDSRHVSLSEAAHVFAAVHCIYLPKWRSWLNCLVAMLGKHSLQVAYYYSADFERLVKHLAAEHDVVMAHLIRTARYALVSGLPTVLEMTDAISLNMDRAGSRPSGWTWRHWLYRMEAQRVARQEAASLASFNLVSVVSEVDRLHLLRGATNQVQGRLIVVPNGVARAEDGAVATTPDMVFIGNLYTLQNRDALDFFLEEVMPSIVRYEPSARIRVIGVIPPRMARKLRRKPEVKVYGPVASLADAIDGASIGICPIRIGAGMQNKLLDYLSFGLAAVTSPIGLEGIEAEPGVHLLCASSRAEWADAVTSLLKCPQKARAIGERGRRLVRERYRWEDRTQVLVSHIEALAGKSSGVALSTRC